MRRARAQGNPSPQFPRNQESVRGEGAVMQFFFERLGAGGMVQSRSEAVWYRKWVSGIRYSGPSIEPYVTPVVSLYGADMDDRHAST
ncbi:DNA-directed RNA polymerase subunit beta'', partial [Clarias magur]